MLAYDYSASTNNFIFMLYGGLIHRITPYHLILYRIISYIISSHFISYHIELSHFTSYHIISYHIASYHIILYHISHHIISYRIILYHITSYHIAWHHMIITRFLFWPDRSNSIWKHWTRPLRLLRSASVCGSIESMIDRERGIKIIEDENDR